MYPNNYKDLRYEHKHIIIRGIQKEYFSQYLLSKVITIKQKVEGK